MSTGERASLPTAGGIRGSRTRSYGSLVKSSLSPLRQRRIEHPVQPGETLQGVSLKYGVSMEDIRRANRLYTNDSIFLKKSLSIPVLSDPDTDNGLGLTVENVSQTKNSIGDSNQNGKLVNSKSEDKQDCPDERISELSPMDFLKRMDSKINQSKQAAVKRCQDREKRFDSLEAACTSKLTRSQSVTSTPRMHQEPIVGAVPLTITKRPKKQRDWEEDIFEL